MHEQHKRVEIVSEPVTRKKMEAPVVPEEEEEMAGPSLSLFVQDKASESSSSEEEI